MTQRQFKIIGGLHPEAIGHIGVLCNTWDFDVEINLRIGKVAYWLEVSELILNPDPTQHMHRSWFFENEVEEIKDI